MARSRDARPVGRRQSVRHVLADSLRRLTRERDQYFAALESLRNPVFIASEDGELVSANRAALQIFLDLPEAGALTYRLALQPHRAGLQAIVDEILATEAPNGARSGCTPATASAASTSACARSRTARASWTVARSSLMHDVTATSPGGCRGRAGRAHHVPLPGAMSTKSGRRCTASWARQAS